MTTTPDGAMDDRSDPIARCAAGEAALQAALYAGHGTGWRRDAGLAWASGGVVAHWLLPAAVTLVPRPVLPAGFAAAGPGQVCDAWAALTPDDLPGWTPTPGDPWMVRDPGPCPARGVDGVSVERTFDALLFEDTAFRAAGGGPPERPGELHPAGSAAVEGLQLYLARRDGVPVGTALGVVHAGGVVVSAMAVLPAERGRGIGGVLTAAVVDANAALPATLSARPMGLPVYRRAGFRTLASSVVWDPP